jgi:flavin-dependent dehydrogenase
MAAIDAVVVGGGPAGAVAGIHLARAGLETLILEREHFPRFAIGESLLPLGNGLLKEIGVWEDLEREGYVVKRGADFRTGDGGRSVRFRFEKALGPEHASTFQVERSRFDALLLRKAGEEGCRVVHGARVASVRHAGDEGVEVDYVHDGAAHPVTARWLVDAGGRAGVAGAGLGFRKRPTRHRKMTAIYGHFHGAGREEGDTAGNTVIIRFREGWFWLIPVAPDKTSVGAVLPNSLLREMGGNPGEVFDKLVADTPEVARLMDGARATMPVRATADYSWRHETFARGRIFLTGDAAGFVDPIFSSGVMLAMKSARLAARTIARAHAQGRVPGRLACGNYTRRVAGWMALYGTVIRSFYERGGFEIFMHPMPFLGIPATVGRLVGGETDVSAADRLRLAGFRAVCGLQRWLDLAPPIPSIR